MRVLLAVAVIFCLTPAFAATAASPNDQYTCGVDTAAASDVTSTSATLNGLIGASDQGGNAINCEDWYFEYGEDSSYGETTPYPPMTVESIPGQDVPVSADVSNLTPDTTSHFRLDADDQDEETEYGGDVTFETEPGATLEVTSTVDQPIVLPGANATFTITLTNNGPETAGSVTLMDDLPSEVDVVNLDSTQGTCFQSGEISCDIGDMADGATVTVTVVAETTTHETYSNDVTATTDNANPDSTLTADSSVTVESATVAVTNAVDHAQVPVGSNATFTIGVANSGPDPADQVTVTDALPAGLTFVSATPSSGICSGTSTVSCSLASIPSGGSATVTLVATVSSGGMVTDIASASGPDVAPGSTTSANASVTGQTALVTVTGSVDRSPVSLGSNVTFTFTVANGGPAAANGVTLSDALPSGLGFVSASSSQGSCSGASTLSCSLGTIADGATATVTLVATATAAGSATDVATLAGTDLDPGSTTSASASVTVQTAAVTLSVAASPSTLTLGSNPGLSANVAFTVSVADNGPADATGVTVTDTLPSGLTFFSSSAPGGSCSGTATIVCTLGTVSNGSQASLTILAGTTAAGQYLDSATVAAADLDPNSEASGSASLTVTAPSPTPTPPTSPPPPAKRTKPARRTKPRTTDVVVDESIGGITIGESEQDVEKTLGKPESGFGVSLGGGKSGRLERYRSHGALFLVTYDANGRVVSLETYSSFYRTASGVGPGSPLSKAAALPRFHYDSCELGYWNATAHTKPSQIVTVFTPDAGTVESVLITELDLDTTCDNGSQQLAPVATLELGHSIGEVSIGMSEQAVLKALGSPSGTLKITLGGGLAGRSVRYRSHGAPLLITYDSAGKVVSIEAYSPYFETLEGIGPGALLSLVRALPGFRPDSCELGYWNATAHTKPSQIVTVFTPDAGTVESVLITELRLYTACDANSAALPPST